MAVEIQVRRGAASVWTSVNPTLAQGEWGLETDTDYMKIGNGTSAWTSLAYEIYPYTSVVTLISSASVATEAYAFSITNAASVSLAASIAAGGGGSGSVSSVFGRTGAVTAQVGDYSAYYDANGKASAASTAAIAASDPAGLAASVKSLALLSANNLSDVADAGTSRQDIHIPALTPVAAVQTSNVASFTGLPLVDGYQTVNGDAILVTANGVNNGPWLMPASGSVGSWTRPTEFATGASVHGRTVAVMNGTFGANQLWQLNAPTTGVLVGTTSQSWSLSGNAQTVYNVRAYGAVGNGSTDDTTAIQAAITAAVAVKGTVYFPPTSNPPTTAYMVSSALNVTGACILRGAGPGSIVRALNSFSTPSSAIFNLTATSGVVTEDIVIDAGSEYVGSVTLTAGASVISVPSGSAPTVGTYVSLVESSAINPIISTGTTVASVGSPSGGNVGVVLSSVIGGTTGTANLYFSAPLYGHLINPGGVVVQSVTITNGSASVTAASWAGIPTGGDAYVYVLSGTGTINTGTSVSRVSGTTMVLSATATGSGTATVVVVNETSYNYVTERVHCTAFSTCSGYEFVNLGAEDANYINCTNDASEGAGSSIPGSIWFGVPAGAVNVVGGFLGGRWLFNVQQLSIEQCTTGPLSIDNPSASNLPVLNLLGCYVYDYNPSGVRTDCISSLNNLCNINAKGSFLLALNNSEIVKGNIPSGGVSIMLEGCTLFGPSGNNEYVFSTSGAGQVILDGGSLNSAPTSWTLLETSGTTTATLRAVPSGATLTYSNAALASTRYDQGGQVYNAKSYGATGNGSTDDTAAIKATIAAASVTGGVVYLPPGTYKTTSGLTCSTSTAPYAPVYIEGAGKWATTIACAWSTASVDAVRMYNSNLGSASVYGGGISNLTIDGTGVSGTHCSGLHLGDLFNAQVDVAIQNFATANSVGAWFDNYYLYTEQTNARVYASNNTTNVAFDNSSPNTVTYANSAGSFDRGVFDLYINQGTSTFDGVVFRNGAYLADGQINIRGNFGVGASVSSAVLRLTGITPSNHSGATASGITTSVVNIGVEVDGAGTGPHTLVCDASSATAILDCTGILNFATAGPFEAAVNPNIAFWGPIYGDATLSELWTGTVGNGLASSFTANGTTGVVVTNYWVSASSQIVIQLTTPGGTPGQPYVFSISAGASITFKSQIGDTSTYSFRLLS